MRLNRNIPIVTMATAMGQLLVVAEANQELATTTSCDKQKCGPLTKGFSLDSKNSRKTLKTSPKKLWPGKPQTIH